MQSIGCMHHHTGSIIQAPSYPKGRDNNKGTTTGLLPEAVVACCCLGPLNLPDEKFEMGACTNLPDHPIFNGVDKIYIKEVSFAVL